MLLFFERTYIVMGIVIKHNKKNMVMVNDITNGYVFVFISTFSHEVIKYAANTAYPSARNTVNSINKEINIVFYLPVHNVLFIGTSQISKHTVNLFTSLNNFRHNHFKYDVFVAQYISIKTFSTMGINVMI